MKGERMRIAKNQAEFDELSKHGGWVEVREGYYVVKGKSKIVLMESSSAVLWESSRAELRDSSSAELRESSSAVLRESSRAELMESSSAELRESSSAVLWDSSSAVLWDSSRAVLWDSSRAVLRESSRADAWNYSLATIRSKNAAARGNVYRFTYPSTVKAWLKKYGCRVKNGKAILYKATGKDYETRNGIRYTPGTTVIAPDWQDTDKIECGAGLHFCPAPSACKQFRDKPEHYVACSVALEDIRLYDGEPDNPDKVRGRACDCLYECDEDAKKIEARP